MHPTNNKTKFKYLKWISKQSTNYIEKNMNNATWSGDLPQAKKHRNKENMTPKSMEHGEDHPQGFQNETIITKT
jgi:hypothetical protein